MIPRLPDFIGVGPPRTATSWLNAVLEGHVGLPRGIKETNFFSHRYASGLDWYAAHFRKHKPHTVVGEFSTLYFACPEARERIARDIPRCKIVVTLRDPVDRFISHYHLLRFEAWIEGAPLDETIDTFLNGYPGPGNPIELNRYATHLRAWYEKFGREKVLVLFYDDFRASPQDYVSRLCSFVGIPEIDLKRSRTASQRVFPIPRQPRSESLARMIRIARHFLNDRRFHLLARLIGRNPISRFIVLGGPPFEEARPEVRARLRDLFLPEVEALEQLVHRDLSAWKNGSARSRARVETRPPSRASSAG